MAQGGVSWGKIVKPKTHELPRSIDRVSFVYLDQTSINVDGGSIIAWRQGVKLALPVSSVICLILGPGATITHDAIKLIGGAGTAIVWMGSDQSRFYAAGKGIVYFLQNAGGSSQGGLR